MKVIFHVNSPEARMLHLNHQETQEEGVDTWNVPGSMVLSRECPEESFTSRGIQKGEPIDVHFDDAMHIVKVVRQLDGDVLWQAAEAS